MKYSFILCAETWLLIMDMDPDTLINCFRVFSSLILVLMVLTSFNSCFSNVSAFFFFFFSCFFAVQFVVCFVLLICLLFYHLLFYFVNK